MPTRVSKEYPEKLFLYASIDIHRRSIYNKGNGKACRQTGRISVYLFQDKEDRS